MTTAFELQKFKWIVQTFKAKDQQFFKKEPGRKKRFCLCGPHDLSQSLNCAVAKNKNKKNAAIENI